MRQRDFHGRGELPTLRLSCARIWAAGVLPSVVRQKSFHSVLLRSALFRSPVYRCLLSGSASRFFHRLSGGIGTPIDTSGPLGQPVPKQSEPVAELIITFIVAMVGGVLCLRESRAAPVAAVIALILLLHTKSAVATEMLRQSGGFLIADGGLGYYLALLSLAVAVAVTGLALFFVDD